MGNWTLNALNYDEIRAELREEFEDERASLLAYICAKYKIPLVDMNNTVEEWEENKEKFMEDRLCH